MDGLVGGVGTLPTTPASASIVAAFQTQEALKLLHNMEVLPGKALMINGLGGTPISELYLLYGIAAQKLADQGIRLGAEVFQPEQFAKRAAGAW